MLLKVLFILLILINSLAAFGAGEMPVTFNLAGRLYDSPTSSDPLLAQDVEIKVQILDAAKACILYEEKQVIDTDTSDGHFAILVGSSYPSAKRGTNDPQNAMATIFQNSADIPARGCAGNISTKVAKSGRYLRVIVTPNGGSSDTLTPEIFIGNVPMALVSETLGGLTKDQFLQLKDPATSELTQSNLENIFSSTNYPILADLMDGTVPATGLSTEDDYLIVADSATPGTGEIQFAIGSTVRAKVTNAGDFVANNRIGIGVDAPSYDLSFGGATNRVLGIERRTTASGAAGSSLSVVAGGAALTGSNRSGGDLYLSSGISTGNQASRIFFQTPAPGSAGTSDNTPFTRMALDGDGQLGIGNSAPARPIHISSASAPTILLDNTAAASNLKRRYVTGTLTGDLAFGKFSDDMSTNTEHMRILSNGNVGIGSSNPNALLDVGDYGTPGNVAFATALFASDYNGIAGIEMKNKSTGSGSDFRFSIYDTAGSYISFAQPGTNNTASLLGSTRNTSSYVFTNGTKNLSIGTFSARDLIFATNNTQRLRITSDGNLGIGTNSPASKLHVGSAPTGSSSYGLVSLGSGAFDGATAGFFTGHASGTVLAANAASGFAGDLLNLQIAGVTKFKVDKDGVVTSAGSFSTPGDISQSGSSSFSTGTGPVSLNGDTTIAANENFIMAAGTGTSTQTYTGTTSDASTISANNLTSGSILNLTSSSTAAASGNTGLNIAISGINATSGITRKGISSVMTSTGASSTNIAGYFSATGATNNYGLLVPDGRVGIGNSAPAYTLDVTGNFRSTGTLFQSGSVTGPTLTGFYGPLNFNNATQNQIVQVQTSVVPQADTTSLYGMIFLPTLSASSNLITNLTGIYSRTDLAATYTGTITNYSGFTAGEPIVNGGSIQNIRGFNSAISSGANKYNIYASGTAQNYFNGSVGIGITSPASKLHVGSAPTGSANYGLVSLGSGAFDGSTAGFYTGHALGTVLAANAASGFLGDLINMQIGGVSKFKVDKDGIITSSGSFSTSGNIAQSGSATFSTGTGAVSLNGATSVTNSTASTSSSTGSLVVSGGAGVSGDIFSGASVNAATTMSAGTSLTAPQIYGSSAASGDVRIDGTSNATKGNVLLANAGGNVGIGTSSPSWAFHVERDLGVFSGERPLAVLRRNSSGGTGFVIGYNADGTTDTYGFMRSSNGKDLGLGTASNNKLIYLTNSGNVGIGTSSPTAILDVQGGNAPASTAGLGINLFAQNSTGPTSSSGANINLRPGNGTSGWPAGSVLVEANNSLVSLRVSNNRTSSYVSSGTGSSPTPVMTLQNGFFANGNTALMSFSVRNSTLNQSSYFGAVSSAGTGYAPDMVLGFATGTNSYEEKVRLSNSGNFGIGTNNPGIQSSSDRTYVTIQGSSGAGVLETTTNQADADNNLVGLLQFTDKNSVASDKRVANIYSRLSGTTSNNRGGVIAFDTKPDGGALAERMRISSNGNVGIGTSAPGAMLEVAGQLKITGGTPGPGKVLTSDATGLGTWSDPSSGTSISNGLTPATLISTSRTSNQLSFDINGNMVMDVTGSGGATGVNTVINRMRNASSSGSNYIHFGHLAGQNYGYVGFNGVDMFLQSEGTRNMIFNTNGAVERMRIDSSGNVGIGTTTLTYPLTVNGEIGVNGVRSNANSTNVLSFTSGVSLSTNNRRIIHGIKSGPLVVTVGDSAEAATGKVNILNDTSFNLKVAIGNTSPGYPLDVTGDINSSTRLLIAGTQVCTSSGCTVPSDERLKEKVKPIEDSLDKLLKLKGVSYVYRDKKKFGSDHQIGVIAQEVEKVFPEVVKTDSKSGFKSVAYDHLVAPLIESTKQLYNLIQELNKKFKKIEHMLLSKADKSEIDQLKLNNLRLQNENQKLQKRLDKIEEALANKK